MCIRDSPKIATRIADLRGAVTAVVVKKAAYARQDAMDEAAGALELANDRGQASAAVAAITLRAKLSGHLSEKKEEHASPLTELEVADLLLLRDELVAKLKRAKEAIALEGTEEATAPEAPTRFRRVIG